MSYERCVIDGPRVRKLRKEKDWSQEQLAEVAGIAERTILEIENNRGLYEHYTAWLLAQALGVEVEELIYARDVDWRAVPELPQRRDREQVAKAIRLDMEGRHDEAAALCREVIERIDPASVKPWVWAELRIRLIAVLDNGRQHREALAECEALLSRLPAGMSHATRWARYHRGICQRRLGHFAEAEATFRHLLAEKDRSYVVSVLHQLGVLKIQLAKSTPERRAEYLDDAVACFRSALAQWDEIGARAKGVPHRKGYTLLRLAEAYDLQGKTDAAIDFCIESLQWLAWNHCRRYVDEAIHMLRRLIRTRDGGTVSPPPPPARPLDRAVRPRDRPRRTSRSGEGYRKPPLSADSAARPKAGSAKSRRRRR